MPPKILYDPAAFQAPAPVAPPGPDSVEIRIEAEFRPRLFRDLAAVLGRLGPAPVDFAASASARLSLTLRLPDTPNAALEALARRMARIPGVRRIEATRPGADGIPRYHLHLRARRWSNSR